MNKLMKAIVKSPRGGFQFIEMKRPDRTSRSEILVKVSHISLNRGELAFPWESGKPAGWDASGIVVETSSDGQGPGVGEKVLTWGFSGAWSQYRVVERANIATIPDNMPETIAVALPVVGLTALRSLRYLNLQPGKSLAITGATGGVGHLLIQLAMLEGINVTAIAHSQRGLDWLQASNLKPDAAYLSTDYLFAGTFDAVVDTVGGDLLTHLLEHVASNGIVLIVGAASGQVTNIDTSLLVSRGVDIRTYKDYSPAGEDLDTLINLVTQNKMKVCAENIGSWDEVIKQNIMELLAPGKVTLSVT